MSDSFDWRCSIGLHRWSPWRVEPDPSPYLPEWALSWRVCERCKMWEWKPSRCERFAQPFVTSVMVVGFLIWPAIGLVKLVEWIA